MVQCWARVPGFRRGAAAASFVAFTGLAVTPAVVVANPPVDKTGADKAGTVKAAVDKVVTGKAGADKAGADKAQLAQDLKGSKSRTRFVIALERPAEFQIQTLQNPNRIIVDLPDLKIQLPVLAGDQPVGLVRSFRGGLAAPGKMRVVIDVTEPVIVEKSAVEPAKDGRTPRLVLEIIPVEQARAVPKKPLLTASLASVGLASVQPPLPKPAERPEARQARAFKPVIVLDPGHGGHDSGAVRNGAIEKEVVLAFGHALRDRLTGSGRYKVLMTRDTDRFIPLDERRAFAESSKAALFIAIHADYAGAQARGATIYSLRESVANDLKRSAKGEVSQNLLSDKEMRAMKQTEESDVGAIKGFLSDLAQTEVQMTKTRTSVFARSVIEYMGNSTSMMSNPDRQAVFRVLKTAQVPAVLIELAYVSNKEDAAKLKSDEWRTKVSSSIATAIDNYFSHTVARLPM